MATVVRTCILYRGHDGLQKDPPTRWIAGRGFVKLKVPVQTLRLNKLKSGYSMTGGKWGAKRLSSAYSFNDVLFHWEGYVKAHLR